MNFSKPTLIAALAAAPIASTSAYNVGPRYSSSPMLLSSSSPVSRIIEKQRMISQRMFDMVDQQQAASLYSSSAAAPSASHRYELVDNNEKFELTVDVPGVKEDDIDIKLDEGRLTVQGQRTVSSESSKFTSKFSKTFSLDQTVDVDKFTASLKDGVLTVSAPKDLAKLEENVRRIPVMAALTTTEADATSTFQEAAGEADANDNSDAQKTEHNKKEEEESASMNVDEDEDSDEAPKEKKE